MAAYTLQGRIWLVEAFLKHGESPTAVIRQWKKERKNIRRTPARNTIRELIERWRETGSVTDRPRSGRPQVGVDRVDDVRRLIEESPTTSIRRMSQTLDISRSTMHRIARSRVGVYPYRLQLRQQLQPQDFAARVRYGHWVLQEQAAEEAFVFLIFSSELDN
jgi:AraC-like DNA-binding protein